MQIMVLHSLYQSKSLIKALIHFMRGLLKMPRYAQLWLVLLVIVNGIVPLFFLGRVEAQATLGIFLAGALLMIALTALSGFSRLLGAGHFLWFILLGLLWTRLDQFPADDVFGLWIRALMLINAVSLAIDVTDVVRYTLGDHAEMV